MKYINIGFLVVLFIFTGCAVQQGQVVEVDVTKIKPKEKKIDSMGENISDDRLGIQTTDQDELSISDDKSTEIKKGDSFNIAVIYPSQVVGKYAIDGVNSITSYLLYKGVDFNLRTYDSMSEKEDNINSIANNLDLSKFDHIVLFMTKNGLQNFLNLEQIKDTKIYVPLINKSEISFEAPNVVFGGIDYSKQFQELFTLVDTENLSEFHDSVSLGQILSYKLDTLFDIKYKFQKRLVRNRINYESFLKTNKKIINTSIFLNTPIVQTSILLSQMRAYEIEYEKLLSTQINYTPLILSLTQTDDRKNMIIASSIGEVNEALIEYGAMLNTNFVYNWVNYSTLIGIDYLYSKRFEIDREFSNAIDKNQVQFEVKLFESGKYSFKPYVARTKEQTTQN